MCSSWPDEVSGPVSDGPTNRAFFRTDEVVFSDVEVAVTPHSLLHPVLLHFLAIPANFDSPPLPFAGSQFAMSPFPSARLTFWVGNDISASVFAHDAIALGCIAPASSTIKIGHPPIGAIGFTFGTSDASGFSLDTFLFPRNSRSPIWPLRSHITSPLSPPLHHDHSNPAVRARRQIFVLRTNRNVSLIPLPRFGRVYRISHFRTSSL